MIVELQLGIESLVPPGAARKLADQWVRAPGCRTTAATHTTLLRTQQNSPLAACLVCNMKIHLMHKLFINTFVQFNLKTQFIQRMRGNIGSCVFYSRYVSYLAPKSRSVRGLMQLKTQ